MYIVQFKKRESHSWRSDTFKSNTLLWVLFSRYFNLLLIMRSQPAYFLNCRDC